MGGKVDGLPSTSLAGCGFAPGSPTANIKAMVEATKKFGIKA